MAVIGSRNDYGTFAIQLETGHHMRITGGPSRGRKITGPGGRENRDLRPPLVRMRKSLFSQIQNDLPGSRVLDLFAGTGTFGLEALSQGAREVLFVEKDPRTAQILERNIRDLGFRHQSRVVVADALSTVSGHHLPKTGAFEIVFIDPPFRFFESAEGTGEFRQKFVALMRSNFLDEQALVILRVPRRALETLELSPNKSKVYGRSVVAFFSKDEWEQ